MSSHATTSRMPASAFFPSPFDKAAILTLDGVGEWTTGSIGVGEGNQTRLLKELRFPHSIGLLYSAFTYFCGFRVNSGEYKLMGLAPYGEPKYADLIRAKLIDLRPDGSFRMDMSYFAYCHKDVMTSVKMNELFRRPATSHGGATHASARWISPRPFRKLPKKSCSGRRATPTS